LFWHGHAGEHGNGKGPKWMCNHRHDSSNDSDRRTALVMVVVGLALVARSRCRS
jgi:hypothetical protein